MPTIHDTSAGGAYPARVLEITAERDAVRFHVRRPDDAGRTRGVAIADAADVRSLLAGFGAAPVSVPALYGKRVDFIPADGGTVLVSVGMAGRVGGADVNVRADELRAALAEVGVGP